MITIEYIRDEIGGYWLVTHCEFGRPNTVRIAQTKAEAEYIAELIG